MSFHITRVECCFIWAIDMMVEYIETIRNNIIQIYINNALNMKSEVDLLIYHFPSLYFQGCVIHFLDLLLEY